MTSNPEPSVAQLTNAVNEAAKRLAAMTVTALVVQAFVVITLFSVTHEMLLRGSVLRPSRIDAVVPLEVFFQVAPLLILVVHLNLIIHADSLRRKINGVRRSTGVLWPRWAALLLPVTRLASRRGPLAETVGLALMSRGLLLLPLGVLVFIGWVYLPRRSPTSWLHAGLVTVDLFALLAILWWPLRHRDDDRSPDPVLWSRAGRRWLARIRSPWTVGSLSLGLLVVVWYFAVAQPRPLNLRGSILVKAEPSDELVAAFLAGQGLALGSENPLLAIRRTHTVGLDLSGRDLRGADFSGAQLINVELRGSNLSGARFVNTDLTGADLNPLGVEGWSGTRYPVGAERRRRLYQLDGDPYEATRMVGTDFTGAVLRGAELLNAEAGGAVFDGANLAGAQLGEANLRGASFLEGAVLVGADLSASELDNARLLEANLAGAVLSDADLTGADLTVANLYAAELSNARLTLTNLTGADLRASVWSGATLWAADFFAAKLQRSSGSPLQGAMLRHAQVCGADLCGDTDLLESVNHPILVDLRNLDLSTSCEVEGDPGNQLPRFRELPLVRQAERRRDRRVEECLPRPSVRRQGLVGDNFFEDVVSALLTQVCHGGDKDLADAITRELGRSDPRRGALSRGLQRAVEEASTKLEECPHRELLEGMKWPSRASR